MDLKMCVYHRYNALHYLRFTRILSILIIHCTCDIYGEIF